MLSNTSRKQSEAVLPESIFCFGMNFLPKFWNLSVVFKLFSVFFLGLLSNTGLRAAPIGFLLPSSIRSRTALSGNGFQRLQQVFTAYVREKDIVLWSFSRHKSSIFRFLCFCITGFSVEWTRRLQEHAWWLEGLDRLRASQRSELPGLHVFIRPIFVSTTLVKYASGRSETIRKKLVLQAKISSFW